MESIENRVFQMERDIIDLKVSQGQIFELAKQANDIHARLMNTLEKLDASFVSMEKSMLKMQFEITKNTESIQKINEELECQRAEDKKNMPSKNENLEAEIRRVDEKGKIDIVVFTKEHFKEILIGIALLTYYLKSMGLF